MEHYIYIYIYKCNISLCKTIKRYIHIVISNDIQLVYKPTVYND